MNDENFGLWLGRFANKLTPKLMRITKAFSEKLFADKIAVFSANNFRHYGLNKELGNVGQYFSLLKALGIIEHVGHTYSDTSQAKQTEIRTWRWAEP